MSIHILGLMDKIEITRVNTMDPESSIRQENPLGKIPILILDDGSHIYDSRVICEYLDSLADGANLFPSGDARWPALTLQALGDGVLDASILQVYEKRFRPEEIRHQEWVDYQKDKVQRALSWLETNTPEPTAQPHIGDITLACVLGYLDFRFAGAWREGHPNLVAWLERFAGAIPGYGETIPHD